MAFSLSMPFRTELGELALARPDVCTRAARGEADAIVELYNEHHAQVRAFAQRLIGEASMAEDLVHEVFMHLPKALARFRGDCPVRSYIISIAARKTHHHVRAAARRRAMESRLAREPARAPSSLPDAEAEREQLARLLTRALDTLPIDQRVAFVMCEVEERTSVEVASMLGEKDATIRARVFHAKKKLREAIAALSPNAEGDAS